MNKKTIWLSLMILLVASVFAACPEDPGCELDLTMMTAEEVQAVPLDQIPNIPPSQLDFSKLTIEQINKLSQTQKDQVNVAQIKDHLEKLGDLTQYKEAIHAIKEKYDLAIESLGKSAKIEGSLLQATFGEGESLDLTGKGGWKIEINPEGRIFILGPKEIDEKSISNQDSFTITQPTDLILEDGRKISQVFGLSYGLGKNTYVRKDEAAYLEDYYLPTSKNKIDIYFNGEKHEGNYFSFSKEKINIGTYPEGEVTIVPQPGNHFFHMLKREYEKDDMGRLIKERFTWIPDNRDTLSITLSGGDRLEVISRKESKKTPLLNHHDKNGEIKIKTGRMNIRIKDGKVKIIPPKPFPEEGDIDLSNSVAFELVSDSENIKDISRDSYTFRTSSSNRFVFLQNGKIITDNNLGQEVSNLLEINMMKTLEDLKAKYQDFSLEYPLRFERIDHKSEFYTQITANMAQTVDQWLRNKPHIEKYINKIYFDVANQAIGGNLGEGPAIWLGERALDIATFEQDPSNRRFLTPLKTINHEFDHVIDAQIRVYESIQTVKEGQTDEKPYLSVLEKEITDLASSIYADSTFKKLLQKIKRLKLSFASLKETDKWLFQDSVFKEKDFNQGIDHLIVSNDPFEQAESLFLLEESLKMSDDSEAKKLLQRLRLLIQKETGLYPYTFRNYRQHDPESQAEFSEGMSTYGENPPSEARKSIRLAHLERDRVYSLGIKKEDPEYIWLVEPAEERWRQITGGESGPYCRKNPSLCQPCSTKISTCSPP